MSRTVFFYNYSNTSNVCSLHSNNDSSNASIIIPTGENMSVFQCFDPNSSHPASLQKPQRCFFRPAFAQRSKHLSSGPGEPGHGVFGQASGSGMVLVMVVLVLVLIMLWNCYGMVLVF